MKALAAALVVGVGLLFAGCGGGEDAATLGDVVQGRNGELQGADHSVLVPAGELTLTISDAQQQISASDAAGGQEHVAPRGLTWVGLDWRLSPIAKLDPFPRTLMTDLAVRTTITLETDGTSVPLGDALNSSSTPAATRTSGIVYIAVDSDTDPVLEVTVDGVTTRVDTGTGEVEGEQVDALADLAAPRVDVCPSLEAAAGKADIDCSYSVTRVPYLAGRGWSDEGWTAAQIVTRADVFELGGGTYAVQEVEDSSSLARGDGESTVIDERFNSLVTQVVVEGDTTRLEIVRKLRGVRTAGSGPESATITVSGTVRLD